MKLVKKYYCHVKLSQAVHPMPSIHMLVETKSPALPHDFAEMFAEHATVVYANEMIMHWHDPKDDVYHPMRSLDLILAAERSDFHGFYEIATKVADEFPGPAIFMATDEALRDCMISSQDRQVQWYNADHSKNRPYMLVLVKESGNEA